MAELPNLSGSPSAVFGLRTPEGQTPTAADRTAAVAKAQSILEQFKGAGTPEIHSAMAKAEHLWRQALQANNLVGDAMRPGAATPQDVRNAATLGAARTLLTNLSILRDERVLASRQ